VQAIQAWRDGSGYSRAQLVKQYFLCVAGGRPAWRSLRSCCLLDMLTAQLDEKLVTNVLKPAISYWPE